ncbi:MAG: hypothetical protein IAA97_09065 [Spirochaetes bacterium]|uniref:Uncharacterized protein n=1 Tax=Candidatus Ornithospirochaeta stercoripullorum TaxID=2840899 RepID=A0A9D9E2D5_9SPIO|nr:hypothetical protein [Candidatus Ornithospirochaeta stercoripullorum]
MRNSNDNSLLKALVSRIKSNPKEDLDDTLFYTITRAATLGKEIRVGSVREDHGKRYLRTFLDGGKGDVVKLGDFLLRFLDEYVLLDGFMLEEIIIEKGFVEELISALGMSTMTAVADDISSYESAAAAICDESLPFFPDIRKWNTEAVLTVPRVRYSDGSRVKERLASAYKHVFEKCVEGGYTTLSIAPLSDYPLSLESEIATSAASAFFALHPDRMLSVSFILPDEKSLSLFLGAS